MAAEAATEVVTTIQRLWDVGAIGGLTDGQLLERFLAGPDEVAETAFAVLVERHGPTVRRVCRDLLGDPHEAQDAAQAAFLVLARRAPSIRKPESLGSWLHGVALRLARRARAAAARRRRSRDGGARSWPSEPARRRPPSGLARRAARGDRSTAREVPQPDRPLLPSGPHPGAGLAAARLAAGYRSDAAAPRSGAASQPAHPPRRRAGCSGDGGPEPARETRVGRGTGSAARLGPGDRAWGGPVRRAGSRGGSGPSSRRSSGRRGPDDDAGEFVEDLRARRAGRRPRRCGRRPVRPCGREQSRTTGGPGWAVARVLPVIPPVVAQVEPLRAGPLFSVGRDRMSSRRSSAACATSSRSKSPTARGPRSTLRHAPARRAWSRSPCSTQANRPTRPPSPGRSNTSGDSRPNNFVRSMRSRSRRWSSPRSIHDAIGRRSR